jgi:hypothetical protein
MALTVAQLFNDAAKKLRAEFEFIRTTNPHPGEKGNEAETVVRDFLNHHLPQRFRATSGIIIDTANSLSPQTDVIVYDALASPVYRYSEEMLILPLDMVAAVIEIKSRLNKGELEDGYKKIAACKRLKKTPVSGGDQQATGSELKTVATYGVIFGFSSDTSLATLSQHAEDLNGRYEPSAWPDLIVLLDSGTISYAAQFPGASALGHMMPPTHEEFAVPPRSIHLMLGEDGDFTLNRFFILLLAHLTFFPRRIGTPRFDQILEGATRAGTTLRAYQYTRDRKLTAVPDTLYKDPANLIPLTITITDDKDTPRSVLRYFPWIDGAVLAWQGDIPLAHILIPLGDIGVKMVSRHEGMEYSNPIALTQAEFRQRPERFSKSLTNLRAQLSGFILKQVLSEGTAEPFTARLIGSMLEIRDRITKGVQEREEFDNAYGAVLDNLIAARRVYQQSSGAPDTSGSLLGATPRDMSFDTLVNSALRSVSRIFAFFKLPGDFLLAADAAFNEGMGCLYAYDPTLATYLLGCRADWLKQWADKHCDEGSHDVAPPAPDAMMVTIGRVAALLENVCVHLFAKSLTKRIKSLVVVEIPAGKRNPEYVRRFEVVLATEGVTPWTLEYRPTGFNDQ